MVASTEVPPATVPARAEIAVTVVLTTAHGTRFDTAVRSLTDQSASGFEVVVAPLDGDSPAAEAAVERLAAHDITATAIAPATDIAAARDAALAAARGRHVTFLDGASELNAKALEFLTGAADTYGADATLGRDDRIDPATRRPTPRLAALYKEERRLTGLREGPELLAERTLAGKLWRTETIRAAGLSFADSGAPDSPEGERPFVAAALAAADGIAVVDRGVHRTVAPPPEPTEVLGALPVRVAALRRVGALLDRDDRDELRHELDLIVLRDEVAELTAQLAAVPPEDAGAYAGALAELSDYLDGLDAAAIDRCAPLDRVRAFYLLRGDVDGLRTAEATARTGNLIASDLVERDGRAYWSGAELGRPGADRLLDVTELGLHTAPFTELSLLNRATSVRLEGSRLIVEGEIVNPFGRIAAGDQLVLRLRVRDRVRRESIDAKVREVTVDRERLRYRAETDLTRAVRRVTARSTAWNISVEVRWKGESTRSTVTITGVPLPERAVRAGGRARGLLGARAHVEPYETVHGNLALRPASSLAKADATEGERPWEWFHDRPVTPLAAEPEEYAVAVIVAAYNVAAYLSETLHAIAAQSLWPRTQLICVDDGSTDDTGRILDEFAADHPNVTVLHQDNAGAGAARNAALPRVRAPYVTFTDSDDILGEHALRDLHENAVRTDADVVAGDLVHFPGERPYGPWKRHFGQGDVTVHALAELPDLIFSASAANKLWRTACVREHGLRFGEGVHFDDAWFAVSGILHAATISLLDRPVYFYRGRDDGTSIMDSLWRRPQNVEDHLRLNNHLLALVEDADEELRTVVARYATRTYANFLNTATELLPESRVAELWGAIQEHYRHIDDSVVLEFVTGDQPLVRHYAAKTGDLELFTNPDEPPDCPNRLYADDRGLYRSPRGGGDGCRLLRTRPWVAMERISGEGDHVVVEGVLTMPGIDLTEILHNRIELVIIGKRGHVAAPVRQVYRRDAYRARGDRDLNAGWRCELDGRRLPRLGRRHARMVLRVYDADDPARFADVPVAARLAAHRFRGVQRSAGRLFWFVLAAGDKVMVQSLGRSPLRLVASIAKRELLRVRRRTPGWKVRLAYWATFPWLHFRDIWVLGDRSDTAQDNAYHLFRWIRENHPRRRAYYVIDAGVPDRARVQPYGQVLTRGSMKHRLYLLHATRLIGSYDLESYLIPAGLKKVRFLHLFGDLVRYKRVFLQHGVIYNDVSEGHARQITGIDLFLTSAEDERRFIAEEFGYGEAAQALGLPRFDALEPARTDPPTILVMPTWRSDIVAPSYNRSARPEVPFAESKYHHFFQSLLTDERLLGALRETGARVEFHPHYEIQPQLHHFSADGELVRISESRDVQAALRSCSLLVTDYSSVFFDAAYMDTPIVHAMFDEEDFFTRHYRRGYLDIARDGFGPACRTVDETVDAIIHAIKRDFTVESPYRERVENFFAHRDGRSRERVYRAITEITD